MFARPRISVAALGALALSLAAVAPQAAAQVSLTTIGTPHNQNFDTLATAGAANPWTDNTTILGWYSQFSLQPANPTIYRAEAGGGNAGSIYSYGTGTATERAFGSIASGTPGDIFNALRLVNNTGATITSLNINYFGEQWRNGGNVAVQQIDFQFQVANAGVITDANTPAAGWLDDNALDFLSPTVGAAAAALDGNAAANRTNRVATVTVTVAPGQEIWLRWRDINDAGNDHGLSIDDFSVTPQGGAPTPTLNISDVTLAEGNPPGTTTFTFAATLTSPAGAGGVTFDIATADGTAQDDNPVTEDNDYVAQTLLGQNIPMGSTGPFNFNVTVNRDTTAEPNETFFVNVTNIVGATAGDVQGLGTINNDDVTLTPIHDIQGPGASSPLSGSVTTTGIVTGVKSNGFFMQEPDASVDADPATSEGIFVFTSAAPPAAAAVGNLVQVTGTIAEFVPTQDPLQPPVTELTSPTVVQLSTSNPLPVPIPLTPTFPDPAGPFDQLERVEGMRVSAASMTANGPTQGSVNEPNATGTSNGVFHAVVTGVARAFREPGIQAPDPAPSGGGTIPPIPRWDTNPEVISVDSNALTGAPIIDLGSGSVVTGLVGPLDYGFRRYTLMPDPGAPIAVAGGATPTAVTPPTAQEFTVASYNLERFFDTVNDPGIGEPVLTATAFNNRLAKASLGIRNFLQTPDIVGIVEVENLTTLQSLATRISTDAIAASQPDPLYQAFLVEGNDVGGIDVGFLVKQQIVTGSTPRVTVNAVVQELDATLFVNADASTETLNDRPPLRLDAVVNDAFGGTFPVTVIVNHLRSLIGVEDESAGSNGWPTVGARVRAKRLAQANDLANFVQARQTGNPAERIVLVGDFNAFEFNDGYVDSMNVIAGTPVPDNQTAVPGDGVDLVNPDLTILQDAPAQRYSFVFDGQAQTLDHVAINAALISATGAQRVEHPRINADFAETVRSDNSTVARLADHDPLVAFFRGFTSADISVTKTDSPDPGTAGTNLTYTLTVANVGPDAASGVTLTDTLPAGTTFVSLVSPAGWSCTTPAVGANGTVNCTNPALPPGANEVFTLTVAVDATVAAGTILSNTAAVASMTPDPNGANNSDTETTTVATLADLQITKTDTPDPLLAGTNLTYQITVTNNGPSNAANATFTDALPANTTFVSLSTTGGWSCTTPAVGANGTVSCTNPSAPVTADFFTLVVNVAPATPGGTIITNTANVSATTPDPNSENNAATTTTTVIAPAAVSGMKIVSGTFTPTSTVTYTVGITNNGGTAQGDNPGNEFSDVLPAQLTLVSASASSGTAVATIATNTVTWNGSIAAGGGSVTITITATINAGTAGGTVVSNQGTINADLDNDGTNETSSVTDDPGTAAPNDPTSFTVVSTDADLSVTKTDAPDPVLAGTNVTYTIVVANAGPAAATSVSLTDTVPANTTFVSFTAPAGWTTTTPAVGGTGTITGTNPSLASAANATFTLVVQVAPGTPSGTIVTNTANVAATSTDPNAANNGATTTTTVSVAQADLSVTKTDAPDPVTVGNNITYTINVANAGPQAAQSVTLTDAVPANTTFVSFTAPAGWTTTTPAVGGTGTITATNPSLASAANATFTLVVQVAPGTPNGTIVTNTATVASTTADPTAANNTATTTTTASVAPTANVTGTKSVTGSFVPGGSVVYTIVLTNSGSGAQGDNPGNELTDVLPASLVLTGASASSGTAVATVGTNTVTWNGAIAAGASVTITINATIAAAAAPGSSIANQATIATDADGNGTNETTRTTDDPATAPAGDPTAFTVQGGFVAPTPVPTLGELSRLLLAALMVFVALGALRRRAPG